MVVMSPVDDESALMRLEMRSLASMRTVEPDAGRA
jgi:hypothetical protein